MFIEIPLYAGMSYRYTNISLYVTSYNINDPARRFTYGHLVTTFAWFKPIRSNGFEQYMYCYIYYSPPSSRINSVLGSDGRCVQKTGT